MGLISRVSSRTYKTRSFFTKTLPKMAEVENQEVVEQVVEDKDEWNAEDVEDEAEIEMKEILVFNKWSVDNVQCADLSLKDYINFKGIQHAKYLPHTAGRYNKIRFRKAQCPIIERLINSLMMHGRNNGKKLLTMRIVKHSFEIIFLLTGENPVQVLVSAIMNGGPREDSTRIGRAGSVRRQACDVSPMRRVNQAIWLICTGARNAAFRNTKAMSECLADELMNAAKGSSNSFAIKKKDELERVGKSKLKLGQLFIGSILINTKKFVQVLLSF